METINSKETIIYRIDNNDIIDWVSDSWQICSEENFGGDICEPINVIGSPLFDFITGQETIHLYKIILGRVRDRMRASTFGYRCDSPEKRRFLNLSIIPLRHNAVEFLSRVLRIESRDPVVLLKNDTERSDEFVRICSMCKKIAVSDTEWEEVESAIVKLSLFENERMPHLTHGLCQSCYDNAMTTFDKNK